MIFKNRHQRLEGILRGQTQPISPARLPLVYGLLTGSHLRLRFATAEVTTTTTTRRRRSVISANGNGEIFLLVLQLYFLDLTFLTLSLLKFFSSCFKKISSAD
jgi:hypothetical protein